MIETFLAAAAGCAGAPSKDDPFEPMNRAMFDALPTDNTAVLIKYTYYGDANFNGKVDGGDYSRIDGAFNKEHTAGNIGGWALYAKDGKARFVYNVLGIQDGFKWIMQGDIDHVVGLIHTKDLLLFYTQEFSFVELPDITTFQPRNDDPRAVQPAAWEGLNILGFALMQTTSLRFATGSNQRTNER